MSITYSRHVKRPNVISMVHHCGHYISRSIYWLNFFYHLSFRLFIWFVYLRLILSLWRNSTMFSGRCGVKGARNSRRLPLPHHSKLNEIKTKQYPTRYGFEHRNKMNKSARLFEINLSFVTNSGRGSLLFLLLLLPDQLPVKTTWFAQRLVRPHLHAKGKKEKKFCQLFTF